VPASRKGGCCFPLIPRRTAYKGTRRILHDRKSS